MSKIVIPKHSADIDEMNAVFRIHYEANDWVKGADYKKKLMELIGDNQYPSSYPKKAQVPAYFGFIESKVSSAGRITERKISASGVEMYEAIMSNDRATCQRLILEALENMIFGRKNAGCTSSDSDIEAPVILVKCILDTGYCTSSEYAYLVWALNDECKKYYEALDEVIKARSAGGIAVNSEASDYKDWKPVLAMLRWGFLIKSSDQSQKVLLHPEVIEKYSERLHRLMIYNIDKHEKIEKDDFDDISIQGESNTSYKPFKIDDENISMISEGHFSQNCIDIENQKVLTGDQVLLVDRQITRLVAYYSYSIEALQKTGKKYEVTIQRQFAINKDKEKELVTALKAEDAKSDSISITEIMKSLINYDDYDSNLKISGRKNKDILPAYLILKALLTLNHMTTIEQDYLMYSIINDKETYTDAIGTIVSARKTGKEEFLEDVQGCSQLSAIDQFKEKGVFEEYLRDGKQEIQINPLLKDRYIEMLRRLSFYAVDIEKKNLSDGGRNSFCLPKVIKAVLVTESAEICNPKGYVKVIPNQIYGENLVQGDFIVFVDKEIKMLQQMFVFQVVECKKKKGIIEIGFERRHVINLEKEDEIIQMIKEK